MSSVTASQVAKNRIIGLAKGVLGSEVVVVAQIRANKTAMCNELRAELTKSEGKLKFLKNSLAGVAAKTVGVSNQLEALAKECQPETKR